MSFRITTNGMFRMYRNNLYKSNKKLNDALTTVQTNRKFSSYAEDPAAASKSFALRRQLWRNEDQTATSNRMVRKFETAWSSIGAIVDGSSEQRGLSGIATALAAFNDPSASSRVTLGREMISTADSAMRVMNAQYGDEFVFAGADGLNVPFSWSDDGTKLLYRGVDVSTPQPKTEADFTNQNGVLDTASFEAYKAQYEEDNGITYDEGVENYAKLASMAEEATYVDIGLGMRLDENDKVIPSSAYNSALSGLNFLGYGVDEDGDPKNVVMLMKELGEIFNNCDPTTGRWYKDGEEGDEERAWRLMDKAQAAIGHTQEQHIELDAHIAYLKRNTTQLQDTRDRLNEEIVETEKLDPVVAISSMSWAQYSYNAALRVGSNILSQSLLDYLN